jgi:anti-sigma factor RsiW
MSTCDRSEELRDYTFDELPAGARSAMEQHIAGCPDCAAELDGLRLTTAALGILPDREMPQRIAFVSDKVFEPSVTARWFSGFWSSASRLGFASACVLAAGLIVSSLHRPAVVPQVTAAQNIDVSAQVNDAVAKAVAKIRAEDARITQAALVESERKQEAEHRALMSAMAENLEVLQKRYNTATLLASSDVNVSGAHQ